MDYLLPLHYNEFLTWYRLGSNHVLSSRLIPVDCSDGQPIMDNRTTERVVDALPAYEDDWEVLILLLSHDEDVVEPSEGPAYVACEARDIQAVYPISTRGKRMVANRLVGQVYVHEPLCEEAVAAEEEKNQRALAFRGGNAVLAYFGLVEYSERLEQLEDEVWQAIRKRHRETSFPVEDGTFVDNLVCYDRRNPHYPQGDLGFAFDLGKIILEQYGAQKEIAKLLEKYRSEGLNTLVEDTLVDDTLWENLRHFKPYLDRLQDEADIDYPLVGCLAFLQMQETLRHQLALSSIDGIYEHARRFASEEEVAFALWLTGAFFDFTPFASEYYARVEAPFMKPQPAVEVIEGDENDGADEKLKGDVASTTDDRDKQDGTTPNAEQGELGFEKEEVESDSSDVDRKSEEDGKQDDVCPTIDDLQKISGVGAKSIEKLRDSFDNIEDLRSATKEDLIDIVGQHKGQRLYEHFEKQLHASVS